MRRLQPRPKERRKVAIPAELRESLREVFELIRRAKTDPDIVLDYDDAIQVGAVCGGRYGEKAASVCSDILSGGRCGAGPVVSDVAPYRDRGRRGW